MNLRTLRSHLKPFRDRPVHAAVLRVAIVWAVYGGAFYGIVATRQWPVRLALSLLAGIGSGSLFMMGHDACHGSFTRVRALNQLLGRIVFLPSYHAFAPWELSHNRIHHVYTNLKGKDFVWTPLSKAEFDALSLPRRVLYRACRTPLGLALYYPTDVWATRILFPRARFVDRPRVVYALDSLLVVAFFAAQLAVTLAASGGRWADWAATAFFAIGVPWAIFSWLIGFVIYFNHTHPDVPWFDERAQWSGWTGMIHGTVRLRFPAWTALFASNIMDHVAHHVDPLIPLVRLPEASDRIEALLPGRTVTQGWSIAALRGVMARCKLYDYRAGCWTDYAGRPTATPRAPAPPPEGQATPPALAGPTSGSKEDIAAA